MKIPPHTDLRLMPATLKVQFTLSVLAELPSYKPEERKRITDKRIIENQGDWLVTTEKKLVIPETTAPSLVWQAHETSRLKKTALTKLLARYLAVRRLPILTQQASKFCL